MNKNKITNIAICVLLALGIAASTSVFGFGIGKKEPQTVKKEALPTADSLFRKNITAEANTNHPLISSGADNIFYTANPGGEFDFYEYNNNKFIKLESKSVSYTVKMSGQEIPVNIKYIERGGKISGFGLYTSDGTDKNVFGYEYIFFKLTNSSGKTLLLASTDKNGFYNPNKVYNEAFSVSLSGGEGKMYFNQKYRTIGKNGISREDYTLFTESSLKDNIFFTGRFYSIDSGRYDVMKKSANETRSFENAADFYTANNSFLREDGEKLLLINKSGKVLHTFDGTLGKNLLRSGDFIVDLNGSAYNLKIGKELKFDKLKLTGAFCAVSPNGEKIAVMGIPENGNGKQSFVLLDLKTGEKKEITEPGIYRPEYPFIEWIDNDKFTVNINPIGENGVITAVIDTSKM